MLHIRLRRATVSILLAFAAGCDYDVMAPGGNGSLPLAGRYVLESVGGQPRPRSSSRGSTLNPVYRSKCV